MGNRPVEIGDVGHTVATNIRSHRETQRLTYAELSGRLAALGRPIPVPGLLRIERAERRVDVDDLTAIAHLLGLGLAPAELLRSTTKCQVCRDQAPPGFQCLSCGVFTPASAP